MIVPSAWPQVLDFFGRPIVIKLCQGQLSRAGLLPIHQFDQHIGLTGPTPALSTPPTTTTTAAASRARFHRWRIARIGTFARNRHPGGQQRALCSMTPRAGVDRAHCPGDGPVPRLRHPGRLRGPERPRHLAHRPGLQAHRRPLAHRCRPGQPTLSRFENQIAIASLQKLRDVLIDQFIASFAKPPLFTATCMNRLSSAT